MESIDVRIQNLVKEQHGKMTFSKKDSNQAILYGRCESIVRNEWGFLNQRTQDLIDKYVEQYIPSHLD